MSRFVIDASVAAKWFFPEPHMQAAQRLLKDNQVLLAPDLIWAEFGSVVWKRLQKKQISKETAEAILNDFRRFPLQTYATKKLISRACGLAAEWKITVYDALYLALAINKDCKLVTADESFVSMLKNSPMVSHLLLVNEISL